MQNIYKLTQQTDASYFIKKPPKLILYIDEFYFKKLQVANFILLGLFQSDTYHDRILKLNRHCYFAK